MNIYKCYAEDLALLKNEDCLSDDFDCEGYQWACDEQMEIGGLKDERHN